MINPSSRSLFIAEQEDKPNIELMRYGKTSAMAVIWSTVFQFDILFSKYDLIALKEWITNYLNDLEKNGVGE